MNLTIEEIRQELENRLQRTYYDPRKHINPRDYFKAAKPADKMDRMAKELGLRRVWVFYEDTARWGWAFEKDDNVSASNEPDHPLGQDGMVVLPDLPTGPENQP